MKKALFLIPIIMFACSRQNSVKISEINGVSYISNPRVPISETLPEPELVISDHNTNNYVFGEISDLIESPEGNLLVADMAAHNLKKFDYQGNFLEIIGTEGEGPGEFREPYRLGLFSDGRIVVSDLGNQRFQVFSPDGVYLESRKLESDYPGKFLIDNQNMLINKSMMISFGNGEEADTSLIKVYDNDYRLLKKIGTAQEHSDPFQVWIMSMCDLELTGRGDIIACYNNINRIDFYQQDKLAKVISRELFFTPVKPELKTVRDGDTITMKASYEPVSFGCDLDSSERLYVITPYDLKADIERDDQDYLGFVLEIFDQEGVLDRVISIKGIEPSSIMIGAGDKLYLTDRNTMTILRYPAL